MTELAGSASQRKRIDLRSSAESLAIWLTVPVSIYPLGFLSLWLQILIDPFFPYADPQMAWYAASLVSRTMVIETGIYLLVLSLIITALSASMGSLALNLFRIRRDVTGWEGLARWERRFWRLAAIASLPIVVFLFWQRGGLPFRVGAILDGIYSIWEIDFIRLIATVVFLLLVLGTGVLVAVTRVVRRRSTYSWLFLGYVAALCAAVCLALLEYPHLVQVKLDANLTAASGTWFSDKMGSVPADQTFTLLNYDESYWFGYNKQNGVVAIPVTNTKIVQMYGVAEFEVIRDTE